jgi:hypothetical protein
MRHNSAWPAPKIEADMIADGGYRRRVALKVYFMNENISAPKIGKRKPKAWLLAVAMRSLVV